MNKVNEIRDALSLTAEQTVSLRQEFKNISGSTTPWYMRVFTFIGALFALIPFLFFISLAGIFNSMESVGAIGCIILTVCSALTYKSQDNINLDPFIIVGLLLGQVLVTVFLITKIRNVSLSTVGVVGLVLELILFVACRSVTQRFLSIVLSFVSLSLIIFDSKQFSIIPVIIGVGAFVYTVIHLKRALLLYYEKSFPVLFVPLKYGLLIALIGMTSVSVPYSKFEIIEAFWWIATVMIVLSMIWFLLKVSHESKWPKSQLILFSGGVVLLLIPTLNAPGIALSMLFAIIAFRYSSKASLFLSIISLLYFISSFYYSLHFTLLVKSVILMISGILFLGAFTIVLKFWPEEAAK